MQITDLRQLCTDVALATDLQEGWLGVHRLLWQVALEGPLALRELAARVRLPVPVTAAVRRELEQRDVLERSGGVALVSAFRTQLLQAGLPADSGPLFCAQCSRPEWDGVRVFPDLAERLTGLLARRPSADPQLDQAHGSVSCALSRALYIFREGCLLGQRIVCLGDDDFTSLALAMLSRAIDPDRQAPTRIVCCELDTRYLDTLETLCAELHLDIELQPLDLREHLPASLQGQFDVFITDPPYTPHGLETFVRRGVEALDPHGSGLAPADRSGCSLRPAGT